MVEKLLSCEFRIFRHFVTIFRNLMIFKMSYLFNQVRVSKIFFTFKFFSEYSFKIANLLWHKLKLIFCCQSYDVIFAPKTVKIKNPKTYDCWEYKVLLPCKVSAQTVKNWKSRLKMFTSGTDYVTRVGINLGSGKGKVGTNETIHSPPAPFWKLFLSLDPFFNNDVTFCRRKLNINLRIHVWLRR